MCLFRKGLRKEGQKRSGPVLQILSTKNKRIRFPTYFATSQKNF